MFKQDNGLNNGQVQYSYHGHVFNSQMACHSDHQLNSEQKVSAIQITVWIPTENFFFECSKSGK